MAKFWKETASWLQNVFLLALSSFICLLLLEMLVGSGLEEWSVAFWVIWVVTSCFGYHVLKHPEWIKDTPSDKY